MGVVHFFPTALGANLIQVSKHHSVLTISWIQFNISTKNKRIYKCSRMPNSSYGECSYWQMSAPQWGVQFRLPWGKALSA